MASVSVMLANPNAEQSSIICQLRDGRGIKIKVPCGLSVKVKHWSKKYSNVLSADNEATAKNKSLTSLKERVLSIYLDAKAKGIIANSAYIKEQLAPKEEASNDITRFTTYGYNRFLLNYRGAKRSIEKYENILKKVEGYEKWKGQKIAIENIDLSFKRDFINYLKKVEKLGDNTISRSLGFIKTIAKDAKSEGVPVSPQLDKIGGSKKKVDIIYLSEEEIRAIEQHDFKTSPFLDNARDWLIIGVWTGQRVSDFMKFTKDNIKDGYLEFTQQKGEKPTVVPLHSSIKAIISKYSGEFPRKISEQRFNDYIKIVCLEVGITQVVKGGKINPETKRKEYGEFPKNELITSHICRRSFASNHYGKLPTPVIMSITNHSTEKQFLDYIGKQQKDHAEILKEFWEKMEEVSKTEKAPMIVSKNG